jgi:hypothetical protein
MRDLTDKATVSKLEKAARVRERDESQALVQLMESTNGRAWILRSLEGSHVFSTSFSLNALQMSFHEGERNRGLELLNSIMKYCPDQYVLMMRERNARDSATERSISKDTNGRDGNADSAPNPRAVDYDALTVPSDYEPGPDVGDDDLEDAGRS